jgi:mono/diheme cytochrome c family protein
MDYPVWDLAMGGGVLMAVVAIAHVIVAHFAIGGGLVLAISETISVRRGDKDLRELAKRSSLMLVLVSTVFGAISGVGIWVVAGLVSPGAISALIHNYVWGWAMEWVFFIVEIVAALMYYLTWDKISKKAHLILAWIYFISAYMSLVVINGIITFMLTPGEWADTRAFWDGFFNPTYWPSLVLRTGIAMLMATVFMALVAATTSSEARARLARFLGVFLVIGSLVSYGAYRWWEAALPDAAKALFVGDSPTLVALASTRSFMLWALTAALVIGIGILLVAPRRLARTIPVLVLMIAAFAFFGGYERVREGVRKPFLIHGYMFSNGLTVDAIETINADGLAAHNGWVAKAAESGDTVELGRAVYQTQCASCHTIDGYQGIRPLLPEDTDMMVGPIFMMYEMGTAYTEASAEEPLDIQELDYPYMPPFVGNDEEMMALAEYLTTLVTEQGGDE